MKLYLAFTGLFLILQPNDPGPVEILFLNGEGRTVWYQNQWQVLDDHALRLEFDALTSNKTQIHLSEAHEMAVDIQTADSAVEYVRRDHFLRFSKMYPGDCKPKLRDDCAGPLALQTCRMKRYDRKGNRIDGEFAPRKSLAGRFHLHGGTLQPAEVKEKLIVTQSLGAHDAPKEFDEDDIPLVEDRDAEREPWRVCPVGDPACKTTTWEQTTYNGALYTLDLPEKTRSVDLILGSQRVTLPIASEAECTSFPGHPQNQPCIYARLTNSFEVPEGVDDPHKGVDIHFTLNYDLYEDLEAGCSPLIPVWKYWASKAHAEPGGGTRCIPPSEP